MGIFSRNKRHLLNTSAAMGMMVFDMGVAAFAQTQEPAVQSPPSSAPSQTQEPQSTQAPPPPERSTPGATSLPPVTVNEPRAPQRRSTQERAPPRTSPPRTATAVNRPVDAQPAP